MILLFDGTEGIGISYILISNLILKKKITLSHFKLLKISNNSFCLKEEQTIKFVLLFFQNEKIHKPCGYASLINDYVKVQKNKNEFMIENILFIQQTIGMPLRL